MKFNFKQHEFSTPLETHAVRKYIYICQTPPHLLCLTKTARKSNSLKFFDAWNTNGHYPLFQIRFRQVYKNGQNLSMVNFNSKDYTVRFKQYVRYQLAISAPHSKRYRPIRSEIVYLRKNNLSQDYWTQPIIIRRIKFQLGLKS